MPSPPSPALVGYSSESEFFPTVIVLGIGVLVVLLSAFPKRRLLIVASALLLACCVAGCIWLAGFVAHAVHEQRIHRAEAWCEDLANLIERSRAETGTYPAGIDELIRSLGPPPSIFDDEYDPTYQRTEGGFRLRFDVRTPGTLSHQDIYTLDGESREWAKSGYMGPGAGFASR